MKKILTLILLIIISSLAYFYHEHNKKDRVLTEQVLENYMTEIYTGSDMCIYLNNNTLEKIYSDFNAMTVSEGRTANDQMLKDFVTSYIDICNSDLQG